MREDLQYIRTNVVRSGLVWVIIVFGLLILINIITLAIGPDRVLSFLEARSWGVVASVFVFDSWGTAGGLAGVIILFVPVLFGVRSQVRLATSIFFILTSVFAGIAANVVWSDVYNPGGIIGAGSSSIALSGQAVIFTMSIFGLAKLLLTKGDAATRPVREFFFVAYVTLIVSTLYFVIVLEPIYIPTLLYNWRVHEIAFFLAAGVTALFIGLLLAMKLVY